MGTGITIATFPVFHLNDEREDQIIASLDRRKLVQSRKQAGSFTLEDLASVMLELIYKADRRRCGKSLFEAIALIKHLCTRKTIKLMAAYAQEDQNLRTIKLIASYSHKDPNPAWRTRNG